MGGLRPALLALVLAGAAACGPPRPIGPEMVERRSMCVPAGRWIDPATGFATSLPDLVGRAHTSRLVLLGEDHDRAEHHQWQLHVVAALAGASDALVLGFEMLPRSAAPALERWVAGESTRAELLRDTDWARVWGFDPELYQPLFDFARMHRVPMRGLNASRTLVARVARIGWSAVPTAEREGVSEPTPAGSAYRERLREAWAAHAHGPGDAAAFDRFVEAQLTWDRAMADALVAARASHPRAIVVGIVGRGHLEHGDGVPTQLAALGTPRPLVLLPWDVARDCRDLSPDLADAVFGVGLPRAASASHTSA
ncbi:MAG: ChaN family lipoprotein [Candidatus Binatia bacterium]